MKIAVTALLAALTLPTTALAQSPAIWSVSDEDTTVYLLGTVHALPERQDWFTGDIAEAYRGADEVVLETVISNDGVAREAGLRLGASAARLRELLPKSKAKALEAFLSGAGAKKSALDGYAPWFANIIVGTIAMKDSPLKSHLSVDAYLRGAARSHGKTLVALETPDEQFAAFASVPVDAQLKQLELSIDEPEAIRAASEVTVRCWAIGDLACVGAASDRSIGAIPEVRDAVLTRRNARWADWVAERMKRPGKVLLAVGVEHFAGEGSLPDILAQRGLPVHRLARTAAPYIDDQNTRTTATR